MMEGLIQLIASLFKLLFSTISLTFYAFTKLFDLFFHRRNIHGSARWNKGREKRRLVSNASGQGGLIIDGVRRISHENSCRHLILAAPSGAGKTTKFIIPNVLGTRESFVVTDPSGEILAATAGAKQAEGYQLKVIDVRDLRNSLQFNPIHRANSFTEIMQVAEMLINAASPQHSPDQQFWNDGAKQILNVLIRAIKNDRPAFRNLQNVRYLLNNFGTDGSPILPYIAQHADEATLVEWKGALSADEKVLLGAVATARTALTKFADPAMCQLTSTETLNFESLRKQKTGLYIIIPEEQIPYYSFFLSILYTQLFEYCMKMQKEGEPYLSIYFLLDEFGNMSAIPSFSSIISTIRKRNASVSIIVQDLYQIESLYGRTNAQTIINGGCSSRLFYPGLSYDTCQHVANWLGKETIEHKEWKTDKRYEIGRELMTADEIRRLADHEAIYLFFNQKPVKLSPVVPFYENQAMIRRTQIPMQALRYVPDLELRFIDLEGFPEGMGIGFDLS